LHHDALFRQPLASEPMMQLPHQKAGVEVVRIDAHRPALSPRT
jgi:hypothetical protein